MLRVHQQFPAAVGCPGALTRNLHDDTWAALDQRIVVGRIAQHLNIRGISRGRYRPGRSF